MRVAVIGANGQLGADLVEVFSPDHSVVSWTHDDIAIDDAESVRRAFAEARPEVVINTAAFHHVDRCEEMPVRAFEVNAVGARNLAHAGKEAGAYVIHVSTDYVFDGEKGAPYVESDPVFPLNVYGNTKASGEFFLLSTYPDAAVVRTSGLYGRSPCRAKGGANFVELMLRLARERGMVKVVTDEQVSPTSTLDLARQLKVLAEHPLRGIIHATAEGECSWYEFARAIFTLTNTPVELLPATKADFPAKTPRPAYSVLENQRLKAAGLNVMKPWKEALAEYLSLRE